MVKRKDHPLAVAPTQRRIFLSPKMFSLQPPANAACGNSSEEIDHKSHVQSRDGVSPTLQCTKNQPKILYDQCQILVLLLNVTKGSLFCSCSALFFSDKVRIVNKFSLIPSPKDISTWESGDFGKGHKMPCTSSIPFKRCAWSMGDPERCCINKNVAKSKLIIYYILSRCMTLLRPLLFLSVSHPWDACGLDSWMGSHPSLKSTQNDPWWVLKDKKSKSGGLLRRWVCASGCLISMSLLIIFAINIVVYDTIPPRLFCLSCLISPYLKRYTPFAVVRGSQTAFPRIVGGCESLQKIPYEF